MILLNFGHPLSPVHLAKIETLTGQNPELREYTPKFDHEQPFAGQAQALVDRLELSSSAWQTEALLVNPPAHNLIALTLLAELHGRMGYFPAVVRMKPLAGSTPPQFEVAEIINLQAVRDAARQKR